MVRRWYVVPNDVYADRGIRILWPTNAKDFSAEHSYLALEHAVAELIEPRFGQYCLDLSRTDKPINSLMPSRLARKVITLAQRINPLAQVSLITQPHQRPSVTSSLHSDSSQVVIYSALDTFLGERLNGDGHWVNFDTLRKRELTCSRSGLL